MKHPDVYKKRLFDKPEYLDMALILGIGFPAFRGGLLRYVDSIGVDKVVEKIEVLENTYGERFKPSELLLEMRKRKATFYGNEIIR